MKLNYFILSLPIIGLLLLQNSGCQENTKIEKKPDTIPTRAAEVTVSDPNAPAPKITFDKVVIDFGKVGPETKSTDEFKITNTGEGILKITKVEQCCGVVTRLDKYQYAPGESGILKVTYNATAELGSFKGELFVKNNDSTNPNAKLTVKSEIVPKIACKPDKLKLFLNVENAGCEEVTINSLDNKPFSIAGLTSTGDCIAADFDPSANATEFVLDFKVDSEKLENNPKGSIKIYLTHPETKSANILYSVVPKYSVDPQALILFNAEPQKPIKKTIKVINNYTADFEIASTSSKDNTIKVIDTKKVEDGYQLDIEITPQAKEGKIRFSDVFYINIKGGEELAVPCTGYYIRG
jgi:hypothetical protein